MRKFKWILGIFTVAWIYMANVGFAPSDEISHYFANPAIDAENEDPTLPRIYKGATFRVGADHVMEQINGDVRRHDNCKIFDVENWSCRSADQSSEIGFAQGLFFLNYNIDQFPELADKEQTWTSVNRYKYVTQSCDWFKHGRPVEGVVVCLLGPFVDI